jgi:hypothetical protein
MKYAPEEAILDIIKVEAFKRINPDRYQNLVDDLEHEIKFLIDKCNNELDKLTIH